MYKNFKIILVTTVAFVLMGCSENQPKADFHSLSYETVDGNKLNFSDYAGKWVVINYWASWCAPCWKEIPDLNQFNAKYQDDYAVVLGVNYDGVSIDKVPALVKELAIEFPVLTTDPGSMVGVNAISALPMTLIVDPQGKLRETVFGEQTKQELEDRILALS